MRARAPYRPDWEIIEASYLRALEAQAWTLQADAKSPAVELQHVCELSVLIPGQAWPPILTGVFCHRENASRLADGLWRKHWKEGALIRIVLDCRPIVPARDSGWPTFEEWLFDRKLGLQIEDPEVAA